jgi:hypothetical protein
MLFCTKVGKYTEEEFETAFGQFKPASKPFIFTYFKDAEISIGAANKQDLMSLWAFQEKLDALGHFYTRYKNIAELKFHFNQQLDKLAETGFIELRPDHRHAAVSETARYEADLSGSGAIAQGPGATAVGAGGVYVGGKNKGNINTGTQTKIDTGGGAFIGGGVNLQGGDFVGRDKISVSQGFSPHDFEAFFARLLTAVTDQAPADVQIEAKRQVEELKTEVAKGKEADDGKIGGIVHGLATMVPGAIGAIVSMFATPILSGIAGPVTTFVLGELKRV